MILNAAYDPEVAIANIPSSELETVHTFSNASSSETALALMQRAAEYKNATSSSSS